MILLGLYALPCIIPSEEIRSSRINRGSLTNFLELFGKGFSQSFSICVARLLAISGERFTSDFADFSARFVNLRLSIFHKSKQTFGILLTQ